jgi:hypothetical protein
MGNVMKTASVLAAGARLAILAVSSASAQKPQTTRVVGTIEGVDGPTLAVKTAKGEVKVNVTPNVAVFGVAKATINDIKPGAYIGVGAMPMADGTQKAIRVMIFAESQRGVGEGFRPWNQPGTTMTNATVDTTVASVDGPVVTVKYKGGEKKILIGPDAKIMAYVVGSKDELKQGAKIAINAAVKKPDGSLEAGRVNVGRGDIVPN